MKIAFFELEGWEKEQILAHFDLGEVHLYPEKLTKETLPERRDFEIISVFVDSRVDEEVIQAFPNLKLITTRSTGYDHIDTTAAKKWSIPVAYVPGYGDNTVAEFAFGLLLTLTRKIYQGADQVKETGTFSTKGLRGVDLKGRTMGVVGTGRIGREVVKIAQGFGMQVVAYDPFPNLEFAKERSFEYLSLVDLLQRADVISIHCPLTPETRHLLNSENMVFIKPGAYLVNTARGSIVDTGALISALQSGRLAGAAMDVLEEEGETKDELTMLSSPHPNPEELRVVLENHLLIKMPNVIITPHTAFNTQEALARILETTIGNIKQFLTGSPTNLVP